MIEERRYRRKRLWTRPRVLLANLISGWPFLVWLAAAGVVVWLYSGSVHYGQLTGVVETGASEVAPSQTARLLSVDVVPGQAVKPGDVLARMDTAAVDAGIAADESTAQFRLEAAGRDDASALRSIQQMEAEESTAVADVLAARMDSERDAARLSELSRELTRREALLAARMVREEDVAALRPDVAELTKAVEAYPALVAAHQARVDRARAARHDLLSWLDVAEGEAPAAAVERRAAARAASVQDLLRRRGGEREAYVLRAATTGRVSRVYHVPGNVVAAGDPVVRVAQTEGGRIVGFLPESQLLALHVGDRVTAWRKNVVGERVSTVVEAISPDVQTLPARLGTLQNTVPRGRRVVLRITGDAALVPGETMHLELDRMVWTDMVRQIFRGQSDGSGISSGLEGGSGEP